MSEIDKERRDAMWALHRCDRAMIDPKEVEELEASNDRLRAEVERLGSALKAIRGLVNDFRGDYLISLITEVIINALAEQPEEAKDQSLGPVGGRCLSCGKQGGLRRGIEFPVSTPQITAVVCRFCGFEHPNRQPPPDGGGEKGK